MVSNAKQAWAQFSELNAAYLEELYERFRQDPQAVDPQVRDFFGQWGAPPIPAPRVDAQVAPPAPPEVDPGQVAAAVSLATAIRQHGYRAARLYPLGKEPSGDRALLPESHGTSEEQLASLPSSIVPGGDGSRNALESIARLRDIYQGTAGYEFEHVSNAEERDWLRSAVESRRLWPARDAVYGHWLLRRLSQVEAFERFLQSAYPTQTRFSLEGLDALVPMLDELTCEAAGANNRSIIIGMAHRGRLNVLAHILGKPFQEILAEFRGAYMRPNSSVSGESDQWWTGDVKYHLGGDRAIQGAPELSMTITMAPNPSHLEFINPVVEGMARAASESRDRPGPAMVDPRAALPVLIHGDAAFPGEGVVAETLNLSSLPGYSSGGALHIIVNNQLGFTTPPELGRSTRFSSDLANGFEIPVIHVNADDPEACVAAVRLAHGYIATFGKDALIDLIGYRRLGHNEGDEPSFTQPKMYAEIAEHPTVRALWAQEAERRGLVAAQQAEEWYRDALRKMQEIRQAMAKEGLDVPTEEANPAGLEAGGRSGGVGDPGLSGEVETAVPAERLRVLNGQLLELPEGFRLHTKLEPLYVRRRGALEAGSEKAGIDWAHAEALAFASILEEGTPIRMTGQDTSRGTFSQRHMMVRDPEGVCYVPLQHIPTAKAAFDVWDSPLSEQAALGFEFGYDVQAREALVLWEAQYGDFVDAAQVFLDAFISSA
ncbi:MAG TPA: thiamine pyrophosphate-dependent enzyme, partial [Chloroflexota bacterium]|nr:thiamine pyrophosphate-dependent enzyme [Chloroflexota bacterium]